MQGRLISAMPLEPEAIRELEAFFSSRMKDDVSFEVVIDHTIIGGVVAILGNQVFDASVRAQLRQMQDHLADQ